MMPFDFRQRSAGQIGFVPPPRPQLNQNVGNGLAGPVMSGLMGPMQNQQIYKPMPMAFPTTPGVVNNSRQNVMSALMSRPGFY